MENAVSQDARDERERDKLLLLRSEENLQLLVTRSAYIYVCLSRGNVHAHTDRR